MSPVPCLSVEVLSELSKPDPHMGGGGTPFVAVLSEVGYT